MYNDPKSKVNPAITAEEIERLHTDDIHAARIVVGLMAGVFLVGLLLYSFIWWVVKF
jgi:hypothetical protein